MKVLFFCNTYYQLIVAIRMSMTIKISDSVSVVLTDASQNAEHVCNNLRTSGIFESVYYLKVSNQDGKSTLNHLRDGISGIIPNGMEGDLRYDELIGFNYDLPTCALHASLEKVNRNISCNVMEEGLLSYTTPDSDCNVAQLIRAVRKIIFKKNAREKRKLFYCFNTKAYKGIFQPVEIPAITLKDTELRKVLFDVFLDGETPVIYTEKYIYLSSIYDFEGGKPVGELDLAYKIARKVGKDNFIVKPHPRDDVSRFQKAGLKVAENSSVPWEIFQIGCDFSEKVLISSFSGSILNLNSIMENKGRSVYTYKLCDVSQNPLAQYYMRMIDGYLCKKDEFGLKNISVASSIEELI